jgi:hypothetical protein
MDARQGKARFIGHLQPGDLTRGFARAYLHTVPDFVEALKLLSWGWTSWAYVTGHKKRIYR